MDSEHDFSVSLWARILARFLELSYICGTPFCHPWWNKRTLFHISMNRLFPLAFSADGNLVREHKVGDAGIRSEMPSSSISAYALAKFSITHLSHGRPRTDMGANLWFADAPVHRIHGVRRLRQTWKQPGGGRPISNNPSG